MGIKIDDTNLAIIKQLRNGRKSFRKIADKLGITENTVRARVARLIEDGALDITGLVDSQALSGHSTVIVGVKLKTMDLVSKGSEFSRVKGVVSVSVVTGQYDLILVVLLKEGYGLLEFYTDEVSQITEVLSVETFVVYKSYNLKVPYIL